MHVPAASRGGAPSPPPSAPLAVALLADRANRTIIAALADARERGLTAAEVSEGSPLDAAPRLIRDRLRTLTRADILATADVSVDDHRPEARWRLTDAGEDLHRLEPLIARIATRASGRAGDARAGDRDEVVERTLGALADPVIRQIVRCLSEFGPLGPVALEASCHPTPRRTLYRRLGVLVDAGAVIRTTTGPVPRSTVYTLETRWRPASAILLLAGWWQARHSLPAGQVDGFDLEGLLWSVLPSIRISGSRDGATLRWTVDDLREPSTLDLVVEGDRLRITSDRGVPGTTAPPVARSNGSPAAWSAALVNDRSGELTTVGDAGVSDAVLTAVRSAVLAYVR